MPQRHGLALHVDHVGSLLRPQALRDARHRLLGVHDNNTNLHAHDNAELREIENRYIADVVAMQEEAGLSVVTDGEFRRRSWWSDVYLSLTGTRVTYDGNSPVKFINESGETRAMPALWNGSRKANRYPRGASAVEPGNDRYRPCCTRSRADR